ALIYLLYTCYLVPTIILLIIFILLFFNDSASTEIYTLSLHDALPIFHDVDLVDEADTIAESEKRLQTLVDYARQKQEDSGVIDQDRKSTRLNSSHVSISYAVFCLKKKIKKKKIHKHVKINTTELSVEG